MTLFIFCNALSESRQECRDMYIPNYNCSFCCSCLVQWKLCWKTLLWKFCISYHWV